MPLTSEYYAFAEEREQEIRALHDYVFVNVEYHIPQKGKKKGKEWKMGGETDYIGYDDDGTLTLYEFKASRKKNKKNQGMDQLRRAKKHYSGNGFKILRKSKGYYSKSGLAFDKDSEIKKVVMVLEMYGPDNYDRNGREKLEIEEF